MLQANFVSKDLLAKLAIIGRIVSANKVSRYNAITITSTTNGAWLFGRNTDMAVFAKVGAKIISPGQVTLPGSYLWNTIKTYPKEAKVEVLGNSIKCGTYHNTLAEIPGVDFKMPTLSQLTTNKTLLKDLARLDWASVLFVDNGFLVGRGKIANQVGIYEGVELPYQFYLSSDLFEVLKSFKGECNIQVNATNIIITKDDYIIVSGTTPLTNIPPYKNILPDPNMAYFDPPSDFGNAVENAYNIVGSDKPILIRFSDNTIEIVGRNPDMGESIIELNGKTKNSGAMYLYPNQLIQALSRANKRVYYSPGRAMLASDDYCEVLSEYVKQY